MDTGYVQPSYNNILIRELYITSNDAGSSSYGEQNYVYRNDRDAILAVSRDAGCNALTRRLLLVNSELGAKEGRVSVLKDGVWRPYKIWGDEEKAKAFFAEIERQKSEEEKARIEYEEDVRRELDEEFSRYKG